MSLKGNYIVVKHLRLALLILAFAFSSNTSSQTQSRPRARDLGLEPGVFSPGKLNAITDVPGVQVGHTTLIKGENIRTGVTAILPHGGDLFQNKVPGAVFVGNAFGKLAGSTQVNELGTIETPIILTNTLSVGTAVEAVVRYTLANDKTKNIRSVNSLVGETNDGYLNDIRGLHIKPEHVWQAINHSASGPVVEGNVGAGTGTRGYGWKGGIGTSSRLLPKHYGGYTVGVLVQTNFGGVLTMGGAPVGKTLGRYAYAPKPTIGNHSSNNQGGGSCMIVVATDAPLDSRDLRRLAARALFGLARTGSSYSNGSGDFSIAFTTAQELRVQHGETTVQPRTILPTDGVSPLFQAALETTEEAIYNSLLQATTITGQGKTVKAIPIEQVKKILKTHRVGK